MEIYSRTRQGMGDDAHVCRGRTSNQLAQLAFAEGQEEQKKEKDQQDQEEKEKEQGKKEEEESATCSDGRTNSPS